MDYKKTHLALVDTYFLLVALSGGFPVSIGSGRLSSLVLQENEGISKPSDTCTGVQSIVKKSVFI